MLVRKCDVCGHIIGDEDGYMIDIFKTSLPKGSELRIKTPDTSIEICFECKQAIIGAVKKRLAKYVIIEKEGEEEEQ